MSVRAVVKAWRMGWVGGVVGKSMVVVVAVVLLLLFFVLKGMVVRMEVGRCGALYGIDGFGFDCVGHGGLCIAWACWALLLRTMDGS